jgi:hypothetical protein
VTTTKRNYEDTSYSLLKNVNNTLSLSTVFQSGESIRHVLLISTGDRHWREANLALETDVCGSRHSLIFPSNISLTIVTFSYMIISIKITIVERETLKAVPFNRKVQSCHAERSLRISLPIATDLRFAEA